MSKRTLKITKIHTTLLLFYVDTRKKIERIKRQWISFRPQRWDVPTENHHACCEKLRFARNIYPNLPQMGQNLYHGLLMPLHDSMPSFMNFRRVLDLLEFKNPGISLFCRQSTVAWCLKFISISCMGPKHAPKDTDYFFNQFICTGACACSSNLNCSHEMH